MQTFWGVEQKNRYASFKSRPIVPGRMINLSQLRDSNCPRLFVFYVNLCISHDSGELETLVMGSRIIVNDLLFEDVFGTKFSGIVPSMNSVWLDDFDVSLEGSKIVVVEPGADLSNFGPLSLCFEHRIIGHIIATTLLPSKGSLSNISTRDMFMLSGLLKKYHINWAVWFK
uniref:Uncharacterized protein n=1 Tax=Solanum tuberosum TaxID=4113 RepID=M1DU72_SOLTU